MPVTVEEITASYVKDRRKLINSFKRMLGSEQAAEDVVQDGYERLLKYREKYSPDDLERWSYIVVRNCARDYLRKERMMDGVQFDEFDFEAKPFRTDLLRMKRDINAIIKSKSEAVSDILTLFVFNDLSAKEIYDLTDYKASQIKLAIYRFRRDMKQLYERGK